MPTYDSGLRRRGVRRGRERGCWVYVPAEELERASVDVSGPPPFYRVWAGPRRSLLVSFYAKP